MNLKEVYKNQFGLIHGLLFFLVLILFVLYNPITNFRYDTRLYWELASQYNSTGSFNLLSFHSALRGYLFPLLLFPALKISIVFGLNEILTCRVYLILIFSIFYAFGTGYIYRVLFNEFLKPLFHALLGLIYLVLWWEYFTLPLSDLMGFILLILAFVLLKKQSLFFYLLSGALLYASLNIRLINSIAIPFYLVFLFLSTKEIKSLLKSMALSGLGFLLMAFPQYLINNNNLNTASVFVLTEKAPETGGKNLLFMQLNWGLSIQKYETNIGTEYPIPELKYIDRKGAELSIEHGNKDFESYTEYFGFVIAHPLIFISYLKHSFNAIDISSPRAYIKDDIYHRSILLKFLNFTVLFVGFLGLSYSFRKLSLLSKTIIVFLFISSLVVIPMAIETRFFLPLHFMLYFFSVKFLFDLINRRLKFRKKYGYLVLLSYICLISISIYRSNSMPEKLEYQKTI